MQAMNRKIDATAFEKVLLKICNSDTTLSSDGWTKENPLYGHCAVVTLLAQNRFGGGILRASLDGTKFASMRSHYINEIAGVGMDFTAAQFGDSYPRMEFESRTRRSVLFDKDGKPNPIMERYKTLAFRFAKEMNPGNRLFNDRIYELAIKTAFESQCQKMWFGTVITHAGEVVYSGANATLDPLKEMCAADCIRSNLPSRTESMLGACGHAEELGLWTVSRKGIRIDECDLYVAGVRTDGIPWIKTEAEHTCLRCSVQMYNAGVRNIFVPVNDHWEGISAKDAVSQASLYAIQQKSLMVESKRN